MRSVTVAAIIGAIAASTASARTDAAPRFALKLAPQTVVYGDAVTISGVAPHRRAGERVAILAQSCRFTGTVQIGTARTKSGGRFSYRLEPLLNTSFWARAPGGTTRPRLLTVRPGIALKRVAAGSYRAEVLTTNGHFLDGRVVILQRLVDGRWTQVSSGLLAKASSEFALTLTSAHTFNYTAPADARLRVRLLTDHSVCYVGGMSPAISG